MNFKICKYVQTQTSLTLHRTALRTASTFIKDSSYFVPMLTVITKSEFEYSYSLSTTNYEYKHSHNNLTTVGS